MAIGIILGFIFILTGIGAIVYLALPSIRASQKFRKKGEAKVEAKSQSRVAKIACIVLIPVSFLLFLFIPFSFHQVNAGEVAVVKHLGKARTIRTAGTYFDFWVTEQYLTYDSKVQNRELGTNAYSKDAQTMDLQLIVQFKIKPEYVLDIANTYGSLDLLSSRIDAISLEKTKSILSTKSAMTIIETRASVSGEVETLIQETVNENYFVDIVAVVITNIDFSDAFEKTVEDKMIAEQEKLKAEYEKEKAIIEAERELEVKKLEAEAKIAMAEAEAKSQVVVARAEATATKLKSVEIARMLGFKITETTVTENEESSILYDIDFTGKTEAEIKLISEYLKYIEYLSKWDGELPGVLVTDGNAQILIPTPSVDGGTTGGNGGTTTDTPAG